MAQELLKNTRKGIDKFLVTTQVHKTIS
jgi:hypothetical protein